MELFRKFFFTQPDFSKNETPVIELVYDRLPRFDIGQRLGALEQLEPLRHEPTLRIEQDWRDANMLLAEVAFDNHKIEIAGFPSPLPAGVLEECVYSTAWSPDFKELMESHLAYMALSYAGEETDPIEQYLALYKLAAVLVNENLLGVVNEPAHTAHPAPLIRKIVDPRMLPTCRQSPPIIHWAGFQKVELRDQTYLVTRGYRLFGLPDLCYCLYDEDETLQIYDWFQEIFHYLYFENREVQPNDAINIDDETFLQFLTLPTELKALRDEGQILLLEKVDADEWEVEEDPDANPEDWQD